MKHLIACVALLCLLTGCPQIELATGNTLVVNNQDYMAGMLFRLSVVRVPDECSSDMPVGVNLLSEPVPANGIFKLSNLPDGRYFCQALLWSEDCYGEGYEEGYVTLAGGTTINWYISYPSYMECDW